MRRVAQAPSHYKSRQSTPGDGRAEAGWQPVRLMRPWPFATLDATQAHADRLRPKETRVVAVERDGWRRVVDADRA